jgi:hypothetical protein
MSIIILYGKSIKISFIVVKFSFKITKKSYSLNNVCLRILGKSPNIECFNNFSIIFIRISRIILSLKFLFYCKKSSNLRILKLFIGSDL